MTIDATTATLATTPTPGWFGLAWASSSVLNRVALGNLRAGLLLEAHVNEPRFGAVGNGSTDDTAAIQTAINAVSAAGGGVVQLGIGTYRITSALTLPSKVTLRGQGPFLTVIRTTSATANVIQSTGTVFVNVEDLQLESSGTRTAGALLSYNGVSQFKVQNVRLIDGFHLGNFDDCVLGFFSQIRVAKGLSAFTRGLYFVRCIELHISDVLANYGVNATSGSNGVIVVDSDCDTFTIDGCAIVMSGSGGMPCIVVQDTDPARTFAPRWIRFDRLFLEAGTSENRKNALTISAGTDVAVNASYFVSSNIGVNLTGGVGIKITDSIVANCQQYGLYATGVSLVSVRSTTFDSNSQLADGTYGHVVIDAGVSATLDDCYFGNAILNRANQCSHAVLNYSSSARVVNPRFGTLRTGRYGGTVMPVAPPEFGVSASATTLGSVVRKMEVFDASGNSLGFVPIYDAIT